MFLGHVNDTRYFKPLLQFQRKKLLANNNGKFSLISNVCPHQGSLILSEEKKSLSCRYHAWSWTSSGEPVGSGTANICNSFKLTVDNTYIYNNLIFSHPIENVIPQSIDLSFMTLVEERVDTVNASFKTIMDLFLDVDHIPIVHKGLYDTIGFKQTNSVSWNFFNNGSIQYVSKDTNYSDEFAKTLLGIEEETLGAFWLALYPYTMIEWQPGAMFITISTPTGESTPVTVLKYRDSRYSDKNWQLNSELWETAWSQDIEQSENIVSDANNSHYEESKIHFRNWLSNNGSNQR